MSVRIESGQGRAETPVTREFYRVAIALGSNLGDRRANLNGAVDRLGKHAAMRVAALSGFLENSAVGGRPGQGEFLNAALIGETSLTPHALLRLLLKIEAEFGRDRRAEGQGGARTLDLDLLLYEDLTMHEPDLTVPHPRMLERDFVLGPLAQIAPTMRHPLTGRTLETEAHLLAQANLVRPGLLEYSSKAQIAQRPVVAAGEPTS